MILFVFTNSLDFHVSGWRQVTFSIKRFNYSHQRLHSCGNHPFEGGLQIVGIYSTNSWALNFFRGCQTYGAHHFILTSVYFLQEIWSVDMRPLIRCRIMRMSMLHWASVADSEAPRGAASRHGPFFSLAWRSIGNKLPSPIKWLILLPLHSSKSDPPTPNRNFCLAGLHAPGLAGPSLARLHASSCRPAGRGSL
jgi:hypothetical protein